MSSSKKRKYHSDTRNERAAKTKQLILEYARTLFREEGYEFVTIEKLAHEARISVSMIYTLYQSKRGILKALIDEALPPELFWGLVDLVRRERSPQKRLLISAKIARQMYDAEKAQMEILRGASVLSPELKELEKEREIRRYKRQEESIKVMAKEKVLQRGLGVKKARDVMWTLTGRDLYRMLVLERGWSSSRYEKWLGQILIQTLMGPVKIASTTKTQRHKEKKRHK